MGKKNKLYGIQEAGFSGCRIKSGMTENFGLSSYYPNPEYSRIENFKDTVSIRNLNYPQI